MDENEKLAQRVQAVEADGKVRFGESWNKYISAIGKAAGGNPNLGAAMVEVLKQPDPAQVIAESGREALLNLSDNGDDQASRDYFLIRERERSEWRAMKGRR
jgi:hypothetical protein